MWAVISGFLARFFGLNIVKYVLGWIAFKAFILSTLIVVYPIVHHSLVLWGLEFGSKIMQQVLADVNLSPDMSAIVLNLTGVGGYLANCFQLPDCFSIILSAFAVRASMFVLAMMPKWW